MNRENGKSRINVRNIIDIVIVIVLVGLLVYGICGIVSVAIFRQEIITSAQQMTDAKPKNIEITRDFSSIQSLNPDNIGWLTIDDTVIDFPLMQGKDNFEYLSKDAFGNKSEIGSVYLDHNCSPDCSSHYNMVHGHNSHLGVFFDDLCKFEDKEFFDSHSSGSLIIPTKTYKLVIFACMHSDKRDAYIYGLIPILANCDRSDNPIEKKNAAKSRKILYEYIFKNAIQKRDVTLDADARVIAFSTCTEDNNDYRTVVFAKIVPENENR